MLGALLGRIFAGLPIWAWLLIIGGGALLAFFVLPKLGLGSKSPTSAANTSGIDPNTGLSYALESALNSGNGGGGGGGGGNGGNGGGGGGGGSGGTGGWQAFLQTDPDVKGSGPSYWKIGEPQQPNINSEAALAQFFGIKNSDIWYNPNNQALRKAAGDPNNPNNALPAGTYVYIPTSRIASGWTGTYLGTSDNSGQSNNAATQNNTANQIPVQVQSQPPAKTQTQAAQTQQQNPQEHTPPPLGTSVFWPYIRRSTRGGNILPQPGFGWFDQPGAFPGTRGNL